MDLESIPGNDKCADCGQNNPRYSAYNLGTLICASCAVLHRSLGPHISKVKSLSLDNWDEALLTTMKSLGNNQVNKRYEENTPAAYRRPKPNDPNVIKEQWIRAKYERKEFLGSNAPAYLSGYKEGMLFKKGKDDKAFLKRRFVLDTTENTLKYFKKEDDRDPKATLRLDGLNLMIVPEKVGHPNGMQMTFEQNEQTRNLFIYCEDGQDLIDWYTAIRAAKLNRLEIAYPHTDVNTLALKIMWEYIKEGWLHKKGPRPNDAYRRRWVTLDLQKIAYYDDPSSPHPKGEIFLGINGFEICKGFKTSGPNNDQNRAFSLDTPARCFQFTADTEADADEWVARIKPIICFK